MAVNAYLNFTGNCREAVTFYADVFGAELQPIMTYGDAAHGMPMKDNEKNLVMHTTLTIKGSTVMFSDVTDDDPITSGNQISLVVTSDDLNDVNTMFAKLAEGGAVLMPLQPTFWSQRYGYVRDRFGIGWQISHEVRQVS